MISEMWQKIIEKFESEQIQSRLVGIIDDFGRRGTEHPPEYGYMTSMVLAFAGTIYTYAYSTDNLTGAIYRRLSVDLARKVDKSPDVQVQKDLWLEALNSMPSGFKKYSITNGLLQVPDLHDLSVKKAEEFLDYLKSEAFNDHMKEARRPQRNE